MEKKPFWKSKTMWVNLFVGVLALVWPDALGEYMTEANVLMLVAVVNIVLRAVTKDPVGIS